jgi:glycosyltransferase involved in cell wall biosynthesis
MLHLLTFSTVDFVGLYANPALGRADLLGKRVGGWPDPESLSSSRPDLIDHGVEEAGPRAEAPGHRFHHEVAHRLAYLEAYGRRALQEKIDQRPDFVLVSPQVNPIGLLVDVWPPETRAVLCTYDVESVRMERLHRAGLTSRPEEELTAAVRFERANLQAYDGIVAVSDQDRAEFAARYGIDPRRLAVVENGVDTGFFAFHERKTVDRPLVAYVGSLGYPPNRDAALRLLRHIMPLVRREVPQAGALVVGKGMDDEVRRAADPRWDEAIGPVEDVRPYLERASVVCVPLRTGSGTKYKVLEAMSAGVPVVCSPVAAEGLALETGAHAIVQASDADLARGVVAVLGSAVGRRIARRARAFVERRHSWPRVMAGLADWLKYIHALPPARRRQAEPLPGASRMR